MIKSYEVNLNGSRAEPFSEFVDEPWTMVESARLTELSDDRNDWFDRRTWRR